MLGIIGWVIIGAILVAALQYFWDDIKEWLNNTAADVVGRVLGYNARKAMQRAICIADRVINKVRNTATIYYKKRASDNYLDKVTVETSAPTYEFDQEVLSEMDKSGYLEQAFEYRG